MMVRCMRCGATYLISAKPEELAILDAPQWADSFPCVGPLCMGRMCRISAAVAATGHVTPVPLHSFYRAINGFGLCNGKAAALADVRSNLLTKRVVEVHGTETGQPERSILNTLVLSDGTRLHFAASSHGACVYFIEGSTPSCLEVFDELNTGSGSVPDSGQGGEEAGRVAEVAAAAEPEPSRDSHGDDTAPGQLRPSVPSMPKSGR